MKPGPIPQTVTLAELERFHLELTQITLALGESIEQMKKTNTNALNIPGKVGMVQGLKRATSLAKHARWAAFAPTSIVDTKLAEADAILNKLKKTPPKRKN